MTGFPSLASIWVCFSFCGTCVPFQHPAACMNNNGRISIFSSFGDVFCILWYMCSISTLLLAWITMAGFLSSAPLGCVLHFVVHVFHFNTAACMNNNGRISIFSFFQDMIGFCGTCVPSQHCPLHEQQWQDFYLQLLLGYDCFMWYMCSIATLWSITHMFIDVGAFLRFFSWLGSVPCLCHFYPVSAQASKTYSPVSSS